MEQNSPKFLLNMNFGGGNCGVGFMSKDSTLQNSAYIIGKMLCAFIKKASQTDQDYLKAISQLLLGMEDEATGTETNSNVASKEEQTAAVKKCCDGKKNCCGQKKKITIKKVVKKKK